MAKFIYKVKDDQGRVKTGTLDVANKKEAERQLKAKGFVIQDLHPMPESKIGPGRQATGQPEAPPRPQNASMVIPPLTLPTRSNPPSGKIQSPAFLSRDPKADAGLALPLESGRQPLTIQPRQPEAPTEEPPLPSRGASPSPSAQNWSPAPPPPIPSSPTLPPLSSAPGEGWPPAAPPPPAIQGWPPAPAAQQEWPTPSPPTAPPKQGWPPAAPPTPAEQGWPPAAPPTPAQQSWPQAAPTAVEQGWPRTAPPTPAQQGWPPAPPTPAEQGSPPAAPIAPAQQGWPPAAPATPAQPGWPPAAPPIPADRGWPPAAPAQTGRPLDAPLPPLGPLDAPAPPALPPLGARSESLRPAESSYASRIDLSVPPPKIDLSQPPPPLEPLARIEPPPPPPPAPLPAPKIDLATPPPAGRPPEPLFKSEPIPKPEPALKLEPRPATSGWPPSAPEPALGPTKLELARVPRREAQTPAPPKLEPEQEPEPELEGWPEEPILETPDIGSYRVEEEPVEVIDSWSKVLPPRSPTRKDPQGPAPARRRRAEDDSYTDHLDQDDHPARRKGLAGCFLTLIFLGTLVAGVSYFLFGHEIADWLEVRGILDYLPEWLRLHAP